MLINTIELTKKLIDIESISGNEAAASRFLKQVLQDMGFRVTVQEVAPGRSNLYAKTAARPRVVFCTHIDTVPPFIAASEDADHIYGRGACDTKGIIAAMLKAGEQLLSENIREFGYLFVVGEEVDSIGAKAANELGGQTNFIIVGEPTENKLARGHKGIVSFTLTASGRACHSGFPELGESAIDKLLDLLAILRQIDFGSDPELGKSTMNIGKIAAGQAHNIIPDHAQATISIRAACSTNSIVNKVRSRLPKDIQFEVFVQSEPQKMYVLPGCETCIAPFGTDIPHLNHWGAPLLFGPGTVQVAHTSEEFIAKKQQEESVGHYVNLARQLL